MSEDKEEFEETGRSREDKALDSVTDYVEDREIDSSRALNAVSRLGGGADQSVKKRERERELMKVSVSKEHIDFIVQELEVDKFKAERMLRESGGDPIVTLKAFLKA